MSENPLVDSVFTAIINAPIDKVVPRRRGRHGQRSFQTF
jgi:hypothetical protein